MTKDPKKRILQTTLRYIGQRMRSWYEVDAYIEKKLKKSQLDLAIKDEILAKIQEFNILNDKEYAAALVKDQLRSLKGPNYIFQKLHQKGIAKNEAHRAISLVSDEEWLKAAQKYLEKISYKIEKKAEQKSKKKYMYDSLVRRGFKSSTIYQLID